MSSRKQRLAAIVLGGAAIVSLAAAAAHLAGNSRRTGFVLEQAAPAIAGQEPLNVNTATREELEALPGIGAVLAERIIRWRTELGPLEGKDDLLAVSGVGERLYEDISPYITF